MSEVTFFPTQCVSCGIRFAIDSDVWTLWKEGRCNAKEFFCPNGHTLVFSGHTKQQKEIDELKKKT